jgi:hypothetical protein
MTTATEVDLQRKYTAEEREALFEEIYCALEAKDDATADRLVKHVPIHPRWAKIVAGVYGKEYLLKHFNLSHANEEFGEGWLNEQ